MNPNTALKVSTANRNTTAMCTSSDLHSVHTGGRFGVQGCKICWRAAVGFVR